MVSVSLPLVALAMFGLASASEPGGVSAVDSITAVPGQASNSTPSPETSRNRGERIEAEREPGAGSSSENRRNLHSGRSTTHHPSGVSSARPGAFSEGPYKPGVTCPDPTAHQSPGLGNLPEGGVAAGGRIAHREGMSSATRSEDGVPGTFR